MCSKSPTAYIMTLQGQVVKSFVSKGSSAEASSDFLACACSPRGEFVYFLAENGWLLCFLASNGRLVHKLQVAEKGPIGVAHHPRSSVVATFSQEGVLKTWKA